MGGDRQHRHMIAVAVEQPVDEMEVARTARSGANRQLTADLRLGTSGESGNLFMTRRHPVDSAHTIEAVAQPVKRISGDSPDTLDARAFQRLRNQRGNGVLHSGSLLLWAIIPMARLRR